MPKRILPLQSVIFLITHLLVVFVNEGISCQEYIEMDLTIFFIISEEYLEWQKWNIAIITVIACR